MRRFWVALIMVILVGLTAVPALALEVTIGGEYRFRARQRTDFDLQAFNLNGGHGWQIGNGTGVGISDLLTWDAPVGALTYGGFVDTHNFIQNVPWGFTGFGLNVTTGQFATIPAAGATTIHFFFDGTAAEEHFGYSATTGRLNNFRPSSFAYANLNMGHQRELARPHADTGNNDRDHIYDRIRVAVDAKIVDGLRAYVMFENSSDWGLSNAGAPPGLNVPQNGAGDGSSGIFGDRASLNIRFAWVDFVLPKTPVHFKIGRQPLMLGHGILFNSNYAGADMAYVYAPIGPVTLGAFYGKLNEVNRANSDDASFWGAHADFAINPSNKVSTFYRYVWQRITRYNALGSNAIGGGGQPLFIGAALNSNQKYESNQHAWGITADGRINLTSKAALFYAFEADILWGEYTDWKEPRRDKAWGYWDYVNARTPLQLQEDLFQSAWGYGVQLGIDMGMVKFDIAHSYGSGDKTRASNTRFNTYDGAFGNTSHPQWTTGRRVEAFDAWAGDNTNSPWVTDIFLTDARSANYGGSGLGTSGFTRRWFYGAEFGDVIMVKPTLAVKPLSNLTADISYAAFWKTANTNSSGAGVGSTIDGQSTTIILWKSNLNTRYQPNKQKINNFLGQEINTHLTWFPYKNLMVKGHAGVFFPGDWFKVQQRNNNADAGIFQTMQDGHDTVGLKPAWAMQLDFIVTF